MSRPALSLFRQTVVLVAAFAALFFLNRYSYALMHTFVELFSIVVACSIFLIAWNARRFITNNYILFVGITFLFVGVIDVLHTLASAGLNVFPEYGANLPNQLWIAARYLGGLSFVAAPLVMNQNARPALLFWLCAAWTALVLAAIFIWQIFPACYIEGVGVTKFKVASEYIVSALFAASVVLLVWRRTEFEKNVLYLLVGSLLLRTGEEVLFARNLGAPNGVDMLGHFGKFAAYYLFYKALVETALKRPYELLFRNLKRSEEELRKERDRAQNYLDVAKTILVAVGADGRVELINRMGCDVLGRPESEILGRNWFDEFVPPSARQEARRAFSLLVRGELDPVEYVENTITARGGGERLIAWHNTVLRDGEGRIVATLSSGEDITERRRIEDALTSKTRELERSNAELDQFASAVSHDLKAPLATIGGFAEIISERHAEALGEKGKEHLGRIIAATHRMERLIADVLAYARVTSRGRAFGPVPAEKVARLAVENLRKAVEESGATIAINPLPVVTGDETQLLELFQNLIGNALTFRGDKPPRIHIEARTIAECGMRIAECESKSGDKTGWVFSVSDNGIGIDARHHQVIFNIFERVAKTEQHAGTGVGLAVCKKIVERHGGRIWVESEPGKGATFYFTLT